MPGQVGRIRTCVSLAPNEAGWPLPYNLGWRDKPVRLAPPRVIIMTRNVFSVYLVQDEDGYVV